MTTDHDHRPLKKATSPLPWKLRIIHLTEAKLTVYKEMHHTNWPRASPWSHGHICEFMFALTTLHLGNCRILKSKVTASIANSAQWLLQYMLLKVQSDEFISATLSQQLCCSICPWLQVQQSLQPKSSCVACESKNVSHLARGQFRYL